MDERYSQNSSPASQEPARRAPYTPYQRPRKHMGVASNDPEYLPTAPLNNTPGRIPPSSPTLRVRSYERGSAQGGQRAQAPLQGGGNGQLHYDRYISTPKKGRSIFTSQQQRQRKRVQVLLAVLIVAAIALALVWFFVLR